MGIEVILFTHKEIVSDIEGIEGDSGSEMGLSLQSSGLSQVVDHICFFPGEVFAGSSEVSAV